MEPPAPLPSAPSVQLSQTLTLQPPLSRRGHGPGLILVISADAADVDPTGTLDPVPIQKWAEEGYAVVQLRSPAGGEAWKIQADVKQAIDALKGLETCDEKSKFGVVVYSPSGPSDLTETLDATPELAAVVSYGALPQACKAPHVAHLAEKGSVKTTSGDDKVTFRYGEKSDAFVIPGHADFSSSSAAVSHSRSIEFLKKRLGGPWFDLEVIWEEHTYYEFENRSVEHTMATMVQEPYVNHVTTITGGIGRTSLTNFYRNHFIFNNPEDSELKLISRTVGIDRVVDEFLFCMTHDKVVDWLLPCVPPTGKKLQIPMTSVVNIRGDRLFHEHIAWDQVTVLFQLGLMPEYLPFPYPLADGTTPAPGKKFEYQVPGAGVETAQKLLDENAVESNGMFKFAVREVPE